MNVSKFRLMQTEKVATVNWAGLLSFAIFWLWGINAYPIGSRLNDFPVNIAVIWLFGYFVFHYLSSNFQTTVYFNVKSLSIFIGLAATAVFLSWPHLDQPLWGDQVYHANYAARHGQLAIFMIEQKFPSLWAMLKDVPASTVIWAVNFTLVFIFGLLFVLLPKLFAAHRKSFVILMLVALVLARLTLSSEGNVFSSVNVTGFLPTDYGSDPHPIFRLSPLLLSSTLFGVSDFGYRAAAFCAYLLFLLFVFVRVNGQAGRYLALAAVVSLGTLPILWHVSYLVEQSVWSTLASAAVFVMLFSSRNLESIPLIPVVIPPFLASTKSRVKRP